LGVPLIDAAVRDRYTVPQVEVGTGLARRANVRDAFVVVRPDRVVGRRILLVDDILTTGATVRSLARAVKVAKPATIHVAVVGVADPRRQTWGEGE
ncbi:MAG: phosphoribosyltransferase family protein, partial [Planctomycetota bacterium]